MQSYHYPPEEMGKAVQVMRPEKKKGMDNFIDTLRAFATNWGPSVAPMSKVEKQIAQLPNYLKPVAIEATRGTPAYVELISEQQQTLRMIEMRDEREAKKELAAWARALGGRPVSHGRRRR